HRVGKAHPLVGAVAERLVLGVPAPAQRYDRTAGQPEGGARGIDNLEIALDADGSVRQGSDLNWHRKGNGSFVPAPTMLLVSSEFWCNWSFAAPVGQTIGLCRLPPGFSPGFHALPSKSQPSPIIERFPIQPPDIPPNKP